MDLSSFYSSQFKSILSVTQGACQACFSYVGAGDRTGADQAATTAMRKAFLKLPIKGQIVMGEGERDKAPMLYMGERVGQHQEGQPEMDIAVDPLEGTNLCAKALNGSCSVLALSEKEGLFKAPDVYMEKIACGPLAKQAIDLSKPVAFNIKAVSESLSKRPCDVKVALLNRDRHTSVQKAIYQTGARVCLIEDGDLIPSLQTAWGTNPAIDLVMGTGGAPEGVLAAAALKCMDGGFEGRFVFPTPESKSRALKMGIQDRIYKRDELVSGPVIFCATALTTNPLLKGIIKTNKGWKTQSLIMNSLDKEICIVKNHF